MQHPATAQQCEFSVYERHLSRQCGQRRLLDYAAGRSDSGYRRGRGCGNNRHSAEDRVGGGVIYGVLVSWYDSYGLHSRVAVEVITKGVVYVVAVLRYERVEIVTLVRAVRVVIVMCVYTSIVQKRVSVPLSEERGSAHPPRKGCCRHMGCNSAMERGKGCRGQ